MLSAFVICCNEEKTIGRCIRSLRFASEIVVVDSGSTDNTLAILEELSNEGFPLRVEHRAWTGFSDQKNHALQLCSGNWVFALDADEAVTPELERRVLQIVGAADAGEVTCYRVRREEFFLGTHLPGGPGCPSFQERLFLKDAVKYAGVIHEYPKLQRGKHGRIDEPILHNPLFDVQSALHKINSYTSLEARERFQRGKRTSLAHALLTPFSAFLRNFVVYGGWKAGRVGAVYCCLDAISRAVRHLKLWALQNEFHQRAESCLTRVTSLADVTKEY